MQADPESMLANNLAHEFSGTVAYAGVDSGPASEFESVVFCRVRNWFKRSAMLKAARNDRLGAET